MGKVKFMELKVRFYVTKDGAINQDIDSECVAVETAEEFREEYMKAFLDSQNEMVANASKTVISKDFNKFH